MTDDAAATVKADPDIDIAAREALILGQPPRVGPPETYSAEALEVTGRLRQIGSGRPPPTDLSDVPEMVGTMLRLPALYGRQVDMAIELAKNGVIAAREREIVVLRVGWLCGAPFEWSEHVKKAKQVGLSDAEIARVTAGSAAAGWTGHEAALLRAAEELHDGAMISDGTWAVLAATYDEQQLIELPILIGWYHMVAFYQNALCMRLSVGSEGLSAR